MRLHIQFLNDRQDIQKHLHNHGWRLERGRGQSLYTATHPKAVNQETARKQLKNAGLLTSSAVRVDFDPRPAWAD
jgi:hypothetical protein